jgi:hypothetical protein
LSPLFFFRKRDVVRGGQARFWSQPDDPEAGLLKRQFAVVVPGAALLTVGVGGSAEERKAVVRTFLNGIRIDKEKRQAILRWYRLPQPRDASVKLVAVGGIEPPTRGL